MTSTGHRRKQIDDAELDNLIGSNDETSTSKAKAPVTKERAKLKHIVVATTLVLGFWGLVFWIYSSGPGGASCSDGGDPTSQHVSVQIKGNSSLSSHGQETLVGKLSPEEEKESMTSTLPELKFNATKYCDLTQGPIPVILMTSGRSGSGSTWQIMTNLTGEEVPSDEYTGAGMKKNVRFFRSHTTADWLGEIMCKKQQQFPTAGMVGIKWKPHQMHTMTSSGSLEALQFVRENPVIRLIRSRRNSLDVAISKKKHKRTKVAAHCNQQDPEEQAQCIATVRLAGTNMTLEPEKIADFVENFVQMEDATDRLLEVLGVPHIKVTYENLYYSEDASEWMRVFRHIGRGPAEGLTMESLRKSMGHEATSNPHHRQTIANYDEVRQALKKKHLDYLLHR